MTLEQATEQSLQTGDDLFAGQGGLFNPRRTGTAPSIARLRIVRPAARGDFWIVDSFSGRRFAGPFQTGREARESLRAAKSIARGRKKQLRQKKNPDRRQLLFHGSFTSQLAARKKEARTPGSFIVARGGRYYVMTAKKRAPAVVRNPRAAVQIYGKVLRIEAQKTGPHQCDAACRKARHRYFHDFKVGPKMIGLPNGDLLITTKKG